MQNDNEQISANGASDWGSINVDRDMLVERIFIRSVKESILERQLHSEYIYMYFILEGDIRFSIKGMDARMTMSAGQIWYVENQESVGVSYQSTQDSSGLCIALPKKIIASWGSRFVLPEWLLTGSDDSHNIKQINFSKSHHRNLFLAKQILDLEINTLSNKLAEDSFLLLIFSNMIESFGLQNERSAIEHIIYLINERPFDDYKLTELAKKIGTNEFYLKQKFKEETGVSIGKYIRDLRMTKALDLIVLNKLTTKEVAYKLGYTDVGYFSRIFKQKYGYTPSEI